MPRQPVLVAFALLALCLSRTPSSASTHWNEGILTDISAFEPGTMPSWVHFHGINYYSSEPFHDGEHRLRECAVYCLDGRPVPPELAIKKGRRFYASNGLVMSVRSESANRWYGSIASVNGSTIVVQDTYGHDTLDTPIVVASNAVFTANGQPVERSVLLKPGIRVRVLCERSQTISVLSAAAAARAFSESTKAWAKGTIDRVDFGGNSYAIRVRDQARTGSEPGGELVSRARCMLDGRLASPWSEGIFEGNPVLLVLGDKRIDRKEDNTVALEYGLDRRMGTIARVEKGMLVLNIPTAGGNREVDMALAPDAVYLLDDRPADASALQPGLHAMVFFARPQTFERALSQAERMALLKAGGPPSAAKLAGFLADPNPTTRCDALLALAERDTPDALAHVMDAFGNSYELVRRTAVEQMVRRVQESGIIDALVTRLADKNETVAKNAARTLGKAGARAASALDALVQTALSPRHGVATCATEAVIRINPAEPLPESMIPMLVEQLNAFSSTVGYGAARLLARIGEPVIPLMMDKIRRGGHMSHRAVYVIGEMGPAAKAVIPELKELATAHENELVRKMIPEALEKMEK